MFTMNFNYMINADTLANKSLFYQKVKIKKKYSNIEINLLKYFFYKTRIYPENVIVLNQFIFFFVNNKDYFQTKLFLNSMRKQLEKKILIIRAEKKLIKLIFGLFPDPYIHDIKVENYECDGINMTTIVLYFITFEERGIAIGRSGDYIKAVNEFFNKFVSFENKNILIRIKCELKEL